MCAIVVGHDDGLFSPLATAAVAGGQASYGLQSAEFLAKIQQEERQRQFQGYQDELNRQHQERLANIHAQINAQLLGARFNQQDYLQGNSLSSRYDLQNQRLGAQSQMIDQRSGDALNRQLMAKPIGRDMYGNPIYNQPQGAPGQQVPYDEATIQAAMQGDQNALKTSLNYGWLQPSAAHRNLQSTLAAINGSNDLSPDEKQEAIRQAQSQPMYEPVPIGNRGMTPEDRMETSTTISSPALKDENGQDIKGTELRYGWDKNGKMYEIPNSTRKHYQKLEEDKRVYEQKIKLAEAQAHAKAVEQAAEHAAKEKELAPEIESKRREHDIKTRQLEMDAYDSEHQAAAKRVHDAWQRQNPADPETGKQPEYKEDEDAIENEILAARRRKDRVNKAYEAQQDTVGEEGAPNLEPPRLLQRPDQQFSANTPIQPTQTAQQAQPTQITDEDRKAANQELITNKPGDPAAFARYKQEQRVDQAGATKNYIETRAEQLHVLGELKPNAPKEAQDAALQIHNLLKQEPDPLKWPLAVQSQARRLKDLLNQYRK